ncbi:MAG: hypothetical protein JSS64_09280 [Bacteroidetes bacterium]|nr:hypothetical protein [Bacteroidota bacterium]
MSYDDEFATVEVLLRSNLETRAVDSFAISLMKVERQMRRIFTFLIFQHDNYKIGDGAELRKILVENKDMYLKNFIQGIDLIFYKTVKQIYGLNYSNDYEQINSITLDRNKIFHGQITGKRLSREELIERIEFMKKWCKNIAEKFYEEVGYDGFGRNAYRKSPNKLSLKNLERFESFDQYKNLLKEIDRRK